MKHPDQEGDDYEQGEPVNLSRGLVSMRPETIFRLGWALVAVGISATIAVMTQLNSINGSITNARAELNGKIEEVTRKVEGRTADRWTLSMERETMNRINRDNPMLKTPDVDEIWNRIKPWDGK